MVPLMSDSRIVFLIWFVSIAVVVAALLIFFEIRVKRKKARAEEAKRNKPPIERMKIRLSRKGDLRKKLELVGKTAKEFFKEEYGMPLKSDYSELAKEFERRGQKLEVRFCEGMFEVYYSGKELTESKVEGLGDMLIEAYKKKKVSKELAKVSGFWDKFDNVFGKVGGVVFSKMKARIDARKAREEREVRAAERKEHELVTWVRKAVRLGYDKEKIADLLSESKKSGAEVKHALKIYKREALRISKDRLNRLYANEGGVAQRIIEKERSQLEAEAQERIVK